MSKVRKTAEVNSRDNILLEEFLPYRFYLISASLSALLLEKLRPYGVTVQRWRVLMVVANHGPKNISQLVDLTFIPQSGLSRVVDQMERDDLVSRSTSEHDSRVVTVHLTKNGRSIYQKLVPVVRDYAEALTAGFEDTERQELIGHLGRVLDNLKGHSASEPRSPSIGNDAAEPTGDQQSSYSIRPNRRAKDRAPRAAKL